MALLVGHVPLQLEQGRQAILTNLSANFDSLSTCQEH